MARPRKTVDEKLLHDLCAINCSVEEIAVIMKIDRRTLQRRYAAVIEQGRTSGKMSLKRKQFDIAMKGNVTMLIWLGKQILKQTENPAADDSRDVPAPVFSIVRREA